jgi:hypothetical protein
MAVILILGLVVGAVLAAGRFKVLALLPVILILAAGAVANSLDLRTIGLSLLVAVASPQIGYLVSSIAVKYIVAEYLRIRIANRLPTLLHAMQTEIGQELRTAFELPRELPREMAALLARINEH